MEAEAFNLLLQFSLVPVFVDFVNGSDRIAFWVLQHSLLVDAALATVQSHDFM